MSLIYFIRHAESVSNAGGRTQDPGNILLSPKGESDAVELAKQIITPPDLILTSPFVRTGLTAKPLMEKFPQVQHEVWPIQEFTYLSPKKYINSTFAERVPAAIEYWKRGDSHFSDGEGAESFYEFVQRCRVTVERLKGRTESSILAFSHQQFMTSLLWLLEGRLEKLNQETMHAFRAYLIESPILNCSKVELSL